MRINIHHLGMSSIKSILLKTVNSNRWLFQEKQQLSLLSILRCITHIYVPVTDVVHRLIYLILIIFKIQVF